MMLFLLAVFLLSNPDPDGQFPFVILNESTTVRMIDPFKFVIDHSKHIRINSREEFERTRFYQPYDKTSRIIKMSAVYKDEKGRILKKMGLKGAFDASLVNNSQLITDTRFKAMYFDPTSYPVFCEYSSTVELAGAYSIPEFYTSPTSKGFERNKKFTVVTPDSNWVSIHLVNGARQPMRTRDKKEFYFTWEVSNLYPLQKTDFLPPFREFAKKVVVIQKRIKLENYEGYWDSWNGIGEFIAGLNEGREELPEEEKQRVLDLVNDISETKERVKLIYDDLKSSSRYLDISLGIGGLQSIPAVQVCKTKYGDCKGLSTYFKGMLKVAGIESFYVLVDRDPESDDIRTDFPDYQFNHVIIGVPLKQDTLYVECTSQNFPLGFLDRSTAGKHGLWIEKNNHHLVRIPNLNAGKNQLIQFGKLTVDFDGTVSGNVEVKLSGFKQEYLRELEQSKDGQKTAAYLKNGLANENANIEVQKIYAFRDTSLVTAQYKVESKSWVSKTGKMLLIPASLFSKEEKLAEPDPKRTQPLRFYSEFNSSDSVRLTIPPGYTIQKIPENIVLEGPKMTYERKISYSGNEIFISRRHTRNTTRLDVTFQDEFYKFMNAVFEADRAMIILKPS